MVELEETETALELRQLESALELWTLDVSVLQLEDANEA